MQQIVALELTPTVIRREERAFFIELGSRIA